MRMIELEELRTNTIVTLCQITENKFMRGHKGLKLVDMGTYVVATRPDMPASKIYASVCSTSIEFVEEDKKAAPAPTPKAAQKKVMKKKTTKRR